MATPKDAPYKVEQRRRKTRMFRLYKTQDAGHVQTSDGTIYQWRNLTRIWAGKQVINPIYATGSERRKLKRYQIAKDKLPHLADEKLRDAATSHVQFVEFVKNHGLEA